MDRRLKFAVPTGRNVKGEVLHWKAPGCVSVIACCDCATVERLGGFMYGVALTCIEEIALLKFEAGQTEADGSMIVSEQDFGLLSKP